MSKIYKRNNLVKGVVGKSKMNMHARKILF